MYDRRIFAQSSNRTRIGIRFSTCIRTRNLKHAEYTELAKLKSYFKYIEHEQEQ